MKRLEIERNRRNFAITGIVNDLGKFEKRTKFEITCLVKYFGKFQKNSTILKDINLHVSQKRSEIEQSENKFWITCNNAIMQSLSGILYHE